MTDKSTLLGWLRELALDHDVSSISYTWKDGYETLDTDNYHYAGAYHPGDGYCKGNPCRFCGAATHEP